MLQRRLCFSSTLIHSLMVICLGATEWVIVLFPPLILTQNKSAFVAFPFSWPFEERLRELSKNTKVSLPKFPMGSSLRSLPFSCRAFHNCSQRRGRRPWHVPRCGGIQAGGQGSATIPGSHPDLRS